MWCVQVPRISEQTHWVACDRPGEVACREPFRTGKEVHVWIATVSSLLPGTLDLSYEESRRAASFASPRDQHRYRFSHVFLRLLLSAYMQYDPAAVQLGKNSRGKPFLLATDTGRAIRFNMSHSNEAVCCVLAFDQEVGIDMEYIDSAFDWMSVSNAYFTEQEKDQLECTQAKERVTTFFSIWTCKEARLKAAGTGLSGLDEKGRMKNEFAFENFHVHDFCYRDQYVGTVALDSSLPAIRFFRYANG